jgi:hypothetical protein
VAVRITPLKYAQICYWIKGNYVDCREGWHGVSSWQHLMAIMYSL